jgi:hypothetical protein
MRRYVRPIAELHRNLTGRALLALTLDGLTAIRRSRLAVEPVPDDARAVTLESLWRRMQERGGQICNCSIEYIDWRIRKHPIYRYAEWLVASRDGRTAWAATREDSCALLIDSLMADDQDTGAALLAKIAAWTRTQAKLSSIQARVTPSVARFAGFSRLGFVKRLDVQPAFVSGSSDRRLLRQAAAWHLTAGDKDV